MTIFEPQKPLGQKKSGQMAQILGQSIVAGEYDAQPFPNEGEIGIQFGTSRTVVREAFKILEAKGLIFSKPKCGAQALGIESWNLLDPQVCTWLLHRPFSKSLCRDFTQIRLAIEPAAAYLAAQKADPDNLSRIGEQIAKMRQFQHDAARLLEADIGFHIAILKASANDAFWRLREMVRAALHLSIQVSQSCVGVDIELHDKLYRAISQGRSGDASHQATMLVSNALKLVEAYEAPQPQSGS